MGVKGKCYIVPDEATRSWKLVVHNTGDKLVGVTNNIFTTKRMAETSDRHDDNNNFGHGMLTRAGGGVSWQPFKEGKAFLGTPIKAGQYIRLGLRGAAFGIVKLPEFGEEPTEIDFADFHWYGNENSIQTNGMEPGAGVHGRAVMHHNVKDGESILADIMDRINGIKVDGKARLRAIPTDVGTISHWEVEFENQGETPFIGTIAFDDAEDKNEGIGLESMAVPKKKSRAIQRIEVGGNYGVEAKPGADVRIGVRGLSHGVFELPRAGEVEIDLRHDLERNGGQVSDEFFNKKAVKEKRAEKLDKVQFFDGKKKLNDEIKPVTYYAEDALARSTFDPPKVSLSYLKASDELPEGGWRVTVESTFPKKYKKEKVGAVVSLRLGETGWDPAMLPPKKITAKGDTKSWVIPKGALVNNMEAQTKTPLHIHIKGSGWHFEIPLNGRGMVEPTHDKKEIGFREDQHNIRQMRPEFYERCRQ